MSDFRKPAAPRLRVDGAWPKWSAKFVPSPGYGSAVTLREADGSKPRARPGREADPVEHGLVCERILALYRPVYARYRARLAGSAPVEYPQGDWPARHRNARRAAAAPLADFEPGTFGAALAEYLALPVFLRISGEQRQRIMRLCSLMQRTFGTFRLTQEEFPGTMAESIVREALERSAQSPSTWKGGFAAAFQRQRILSAALNAVIYHQRDRREGIKWNPFAGLRLEPSIGERVAWPERLPALMIEAADALGYVEVGDLIAWGAGTGQRLGDILTWPETVVRPGQPLTHQPRKTRRKMMARKKGRVSFTWEKIPGLRERYAAMQARRRRLRAGRIGRKSAGGHVVVDPVAFIFHPDNGRGRAGHHRLQMRWREVRAKVAAQVPVLEADFIVEHDAARPHTFQVARAELGGLRHTAVTNLYRAGASLGQIRQITGHDEATAALMLERYGFNTVAGADAALDLLARRAAALAPPVSLVARRPAVQRRAPKTGTAGLAAPRKKRRAG